MKILKNSKALSPVVASIILIAVTVAVSIAVAAWMGALSFNFMGTEQLSFTAYTWNSPTTGYFNFTVKNTGSSGLTITDVRVDGATQTTMYYRTTGAWTGFTPGTNTVTLDKGLSAQFSVNGTYVPGIQYEFTAITAKGNIFGPYIKAAP
jgi:flagellin-like protein